MLAPRPKVHKATILVVDDDADFLANLVDILCDSGCDVDSAGNGEAGLELAEQRHYDVALLDLKLPGMDGVTLCRRVKKLRPAAKVMIISAFASDTSLKEAASAGASQVLLKPLDCAQLISFIQGAFDEN
jgi:CheY-like chemotaxis protein